MLKKIEFLISIGSYYKKQLTQHPELFRNRVAILENKVKLKIAPRYSWKHWGNLLKNKLTQRAKSKGEQTCFIYIIYAQGETLQAYKRYFLEKISGSFDQVIIVINGQLNEEDVRVLHKYGEVYQRENTGYDVGGFKYAIEQLGYEKIATYETLFLVNDTLIGPLFPIQEMLYKMKQKNIDFWGIAYGEKQNDFTRLNEYGYIPVHLQTYFLAINHTLLRNKSFKQYWTKITPATTRNEAIAYHETKFTKYFEDRGFRSASFASDACDSAMFKHPLKLVKEKNVPFIKTTSIKQMNRNYTQWMGEDYASPYDDVRAYISNSTNYPVELIDEVYNESQFQKKQIIIIDGTNGVIPQLDRYRVQNKKEQLESLGYSVRVTTLNDCTIEIFANCFMIIIYRAIKTSFLVDLCGRAKKMGIPVLYELDDLIVDVNYTNQLTYVQKLSPFEKNKYDQTVFSYRDMLLLTDGIIVSTLKLKQEMKSFNKPVYINRNLASQELLSISKSVLSKKETEQKMTLGYFSGSITHNENFLLITDSLADLFESYPNLNLVVVGYLDIPSRLKAFKNRITVHDFVSWDMLPKFISSIDINLAPLVESVFNECKSEIKWIEASLLKVPTIASDVGGFKEMIQSGDTGILVQSDWTTQIKSLIDSPEYRARVGQSAYDYVIKYCQTNKHDDDLTSLILKEYVR